MTTESPKPSSIGSDGTDQHGIEEFDGRIEIGPQFSAREVSVVICLER